MMPKLKRVLAIVLMIVLIAGVGNLVSYWASFTPGIGSLLIILAGVFGGFLTTILVHWLGFRMHNPMGLSRWMPPKAADILTAVASSFGFTVVFYMVMQWIANEVAEGGAIYPNMMVISGIIALLPILLLSILWDWLGFRVQRVNENETLPEKQKRTSRIDALFTDLSPAEIQELRQRLLAVEDDRITEDVLDDIAAYEEKAKRDRTHRLQSER